MQNAREIDDRPLLGNLKKVLGAERGCLADFIGYLGEADRRQ